jgi:hypothetical protein
VGLEADRRGQISHRWLSKAYFSDVKPVVSTSLLVAAVVLGVLVFWALVIGAIRQWME